MKHILWGDVSSLGSKDAILAVGAESTFASLNLRSSNAPPTSDVMAHVEQL